MLSVSDILKLLDKIPVWQRLSRLPGEVEELRRRVDALEGKGQRIDAANLCPICEVGTLKVKKVTPHPHFGEMGVQIRHLHCNNESCSHAEERDYEPPRR